MSNKKLNLFKKRRLRNRNKIKSTDNKRIRMSVHRSSKNIYVQLIDDNIGSTIASASSRMSAIGKNLKNNMKIYTSTNLKTFLGKSDIVVSILPNTNETKDFIDSSFLNKMKNINNET